LSKHRFQNMGSSIDNFLAASKDKIGEARELTKDAWAIPNVRLFVVGGTALWMLYKGVLTPMQTQATKLSELEAELSSHLKETPAQVYTVPQDTTLQEYVEKETYSSPDPPEPDDNKDLTEKYKTRTVRKDLPKIKANQNLVDNLEAVSAGNGLEIDLSKLQLPKNMEFNDLVLRVGIADKDHTMYIYHVGKDKKVRITDSIAEIKDGKLKLIDDVGSLYVGELRKDNSFHIVASSYI